MAEGRVAERRGGWAWLGRVAAEVVGFAAFAALVFTGIALVFAWEGGPFTGVAFRELVALALLVAVYGRTLETRHALGRYLQFALRLAPLAGLIFFTPLVARLLLPYPGLDPALTLRLALVVLAAGLLLGTLALLNVVVHESGHALLARMLGYRLRAMRIGPLVLRWSSSGPRLRTSKNRVSGGFTSYWYAPKRRMRLRLALIALAGPVAGLLLGGIALFGAALLDRALPRLSAGASTLTLGDIAISLPALLVLALLIFGLATLNNNLYNLLPQGTLDGAHTIHAAQGGPRFTLRLTLFELGDLDARAMRPREWPAELVARAVALAREKPRNPDAFQMAYFHALDRGDAIQAGAWLDLLLIWEPRLDGDQCAELAYYVARYGHQPELARQWLERARLANCEQCLAFRAEAAIALAENRPDAVRAAAEAGLAALARQDPHDDEAPWGLIAMWHEQLQSLSAVDAEVPAVGRSAWPTRAAS